MLGLPVDTFIALLCVLAVPLLAYGLFRYDRVRRLTTSDTPS